MKKCLSIIIAVVMVSALFASAIVTNAAEDKLGIVIDTVQASAGEQVVVNVRFVNNPGVSSTKISIHYGDLEYVKATFPIYDPDDEGAMRSSKNKADDKTLVLNWITADNEVSGDQVYAKITFNVPADAAKGTDYPLTGTVDQEDVFNVTGDNVAFELTDGSVGVPYTTAEEIMTAAYALEAGQTLGGGKYTLSGVVTAVNTPYSAQYGDVTVTMTVDDVEEGHNSIQCFRMINGEGIEGVDKVDVGYKITVTGVIKNYKDTIEFDAGCTLDAFEEGTVTPPTYETPEEIMAAAYDLDQNTALSGGPYTLTGVITEVITAYSARYGNITVTMTVNDVEEGHNSIQCYRMVNGENVEGVDKIGVGDTITVTGQIKNYNGTVEFDAGCTLDAFTKAASPYDTPEKIVNALYELDPNTSLPYGPYTLTGVITEVNTAYSTQYGNITVTIVVGDMTDKPVQCYRMVNGEDVDAVDKIGVGDTITVTGELKHYQKNSVSTYEFDSGCQLIEAVLNPKFKTQQISLAGDLGVHFYMDLSMLTEAERAASYVEFTVSGKTVKADFDADHKNASGEYYGFSCRVNALQMAEKIHAVYHYGEDLTVEKDYSVEDYINYVDNNSDDFDDATIDLVQAINDYGYFAQLYMAESHAKLVIGEGGYAAMEGNFNDGDIFDIGTGRFGIEKMSDVSVGMSLLLDSQISVELTAASSALGASFEGKEFTETEKVGKRFRLAISGINAQDLDKEIVFKVDGAAARKLCALSYAEFVIEKEGSSENAVSCMWALINLNFCAQEYINN